MGMTTPLMHAQLAWLSHPQELSEALTRFSGNLWRAADALLAPRPGHAQPGRGAAPIPTTRASPTRSGAIPPAWDIDQGVVSAFTHRRRTCSSRRRGSRTRSVAAPRSGGASGSTWWRRPITSGQSGGDGARGDQRREPARGLQDLPGRRPGRERPHDSNRTTSSSARIWRRRRARWCSATACSS